MTELERLKEEKKALEAKIRALENKENACGKVKLHIGNGSRDDWCVSVLKEQIGWNCKPRWMQIVCGQDKAEVLKALDAIGCDILTLLQREKVEA